MAPTDMRSFRENEVRNLSEPMTCRQISADDLDVALLLSEDISDTVASFVFHQTIIR